MKVSLSRVQNIITKGGNIRWSLMQNQLCSSCESPNIVEIRIYPGVIVVPVTDEGPKSHTWQLALCEGCSTTLNEIKQRSINSRRH
jgi:hypothetical protein